MRKIFICLLVAINFLNYEASARSSGNDSLLVRKCQDFDLTGDGRSNQWNSTEWITLNSPLTGNESYDTRVKVLYSPTGIYFLFNCADKKIISTMKSDNLNLWEEDVVEVFLWTGKDLPVYFEYELSPYNFELPIMVPNNKGVFLGWLPWKFEGDRKTRHSTSILKTGEDGIKGWIAEFYIPYKLLAPLENVPPVSGTRWRANMYRIDYDNGNEVPFAWQKVSNTFHEYKNFGTFIFE